MNLRSILLSAIILYSTLFTSCGNAQSPQKAETSPIGQISYQEWKEETKTNIRLLPKYGNILKTDKQKKADNELINTIVKEQGTKRKGSEAMINRGFDYLYRGDTKTAMYRFNQAWLLDSTNVDVYWGFGAVYHSLQQYALAMAQYDDGLRLDPNNSKIITDKATIYLIDFQKNNDTNKLKDAIRLFEQSYALDSKNQNTLFKLSVSHFLNNDCKKARRYYNECITLDGRPVTQEYTKALNQRCKG
jgi:tetratricopeptide (TPR) repeat protein